MSRMVGLAKGACHKAILSLRMPPLAAVLIVGAPLLVTVSLWAMRAEHYHANVNLIYYPTCALVYLVWVFPILGFMLFSFPQLRPNPPHPPKHRFICMIPAYNEERVIVNPVLSLLGQDYPAELYEIWVIFDGTDNTAQIAGDLGAKVMFTPTRGFGKHRALDYAFRELLSEDDDRYVAVFDADNVVGTNYLQSMNNAIETRGFRCMQAFHDVLNGSDNWITKALWCSCVSASRMYLTGRMRTFCSVLICGTGWCCEAKLLRKHWGGTRTQTEDIELNGILAVESGVRVGYVPEAHIYDEKPQNIWVAIRQRMRWMCGHSRVAYYHFFRCLWQGIVRGDIALLELALYYLVPFALLASFLTWPILAGIWVRDFTITGPLAGGTVQRVFEGIALFFIFGYQVVGFWGAEKLGKNPFVRGGRVLLYSFYTLIFTVLAWPPAVIWAIFSVGKADWLYHTPHVSNVTVNAEAEPDLALAQGAPGRPSALEVSVEQGLIKPGGESAQRARCPSERSSAASIAEGVIL